MTTRINWKRRFEDAQRVLADDYRVLKNVPCACPKHWEKGELVKDDGKECGPCRQIAAHESRQEAPIADPA